MFVIFMYYSIDDDLIIGVNGEDLDLCIFKGQNFAQVQYEKNKRNIWKPALVSCLIYTYYSIE